MTPSELEAAIRERQERIEQLQLMREATNDPNLAYGYSITQRRLASEVAVLVGQRTPETVARMERERGLA